MIGLSIDGGAGTRNVIINHGTITGGTSSIATSQNPTRDVVRNDGILTGSVHLGAGNDVYDGRGGRATEVSGETGDDTYFVYNKQTVIVEATGEGNDTVKALTNWTLDNGFENLKLLGKSGLTATGNAESNVMKGNSGANILYGLDSDDVLNGGRGDDMLYGGADYDTFVFAKGSGHDHIGDYNGMQDTIDLRGIDGLKTFDDVLEHARETAQGVSLSFGRGDVLTIDGAQLVDLAQDHFMF
jgi:Ca2+-binding RTX toxin-like protein